MANLLITYTFIMLIANIVTIVNLRKPHSYFQERLETSLYQFKQLGISTNAFIKTLYITLAYYGLFYVLVGIHFGGLLIYWSALMFVLYIGTTLTHMNSLREGKYPPFKWYSKSGVILQSLYLMYVGYRLIFGG